METKGEKREGENVGKKKRKRRAYEKEVQELKAGSPKVPAAVGDRRPESNLPPAKSIFEASERREGNAGARTGLLLGMPTPAFVVLTSRGMPLHLRPQALAELLPDTQLFELCVGDALPRQESVAGCPGGPEGGCRAFWPYLEGHRSYCAFRNARLPMSIHGGDSLCSVETTGGRRKVGPKELLGVQRAMRMDIVAAPGEDVPLEVTALRRLSRAVVRAGDWLKEILEAKAAEPGLGFDWHVLASIQGGGNTKLRQKACQDAASMPVAGVWIGGLGYDESLAARARVLETCAGALPPALPRFLPLNAGSPVEVLQAVLMGVDVFEMAYPMQLASQGVALLFSCDMPAAGADAVGAEAEAEALRCLLPQPEEKEPAQPPAAVKQLHLRAPELKEDFGPISEDSPVRQYSRAYLYHLMEVRELLGTMLLAQHNLHRYNALFNAIRAHTNQGTLGRFAAWFLRTQTCDDVPAVPQDGLRKRSRKC